jgi:hypothetical protein
MMNQRCPKCDARNVAHLEFRHLSATKLSTCLNPVCMHRWMRQREPLEALALVLAPLSQHTLARSRLKCHNPDQPQHQYQS